MKKLAYSTMILGLLVAGCSTTGSTVDVEVDSSEAMASEAMEVSSVDAMDSSEAMTEGSESSESSSSEAAEVEVETTTSVEAGTSL